MTSLAEKQKRVQQEIDRLQLLQKSIYRTSGMWKRDQYLLIEKEIYRLREVLEQFKSARRNNDQITSDLLLEVERLGPNINDTDRLQEFLKPLKSGPYADDTNVRALVVEVERLWRLDTNTNAARVQSLEHKHMCTDADTTPARTARTVGARAPRAAAPRGIGARCARAAAPLREWCEINAVDAAILLAVGVGFFHISKAIFGLVDMVLPAIVSVAGTIAVCAVSVFGLLLLKSLMPTRVRDSRPSPHPDERNPDTHPLAIVVPVWG